MKIGKIHFSVNANKPDALANLDDERLKQAMKLLAEIAKERQVILFTCRK